MMGSMIDKFVENKGRHMSKRELDLLSYEIRDFLITNVSATDGHLASNLGVVELTIALHSVFDVGHDRIVWDVGHQTYVHKILTGRAGQFPTLRQYGGISGFPRTGEDPADVYNSGHGSTSISAAMGLAEARDIRDEDYHVVAVIGDGALMGGLAYEGLNNAGNRQTRIIVVLNDNEMSISENTGSVAQYLSTLRASQKYQSAKQVLKERMARIPRVGESMVQGAGRMKNLMRYAVVPGTLFEELGFKYYGPIDGHSIGDMIALFEEVKLLDGPILIHTVTKKGKGRLKLDPQNVSLSDGGVTTWSKVAGDTMMELAEKDPDIVCVSAGMTESAGLSDFAKSYFKHFYDVGIAEEHAVVFAAGLALGGLKPFVFIYSTFLQRAYDQIVSDICTQKLPVVFMIDRAGNVGGDGETHHGVFDLSYLGHIPGLVIMAPTDGDELRDMVFFALDLNRPVAIRYPRGEAPSPGPHGEKEAGPLELGVSERLTRGTDTRVELFAVGRMAGIALEAAALLEAQGVSAGVVNARFVAPVDEDSICSAAERGASIVTLEDNVLKGGFGENICGILAGKGLGAPILCIGWPDEYIGHGSVDELLTHYGLDAKGVADRIVEFLKETAKV